MRVAHTPVTAKRRFGPVLVNSAAAGSRVVSAVLGILQLSLAARLLDATQYGAAAVAIAFAAMVTVAFEPPILGYQRLGSHVRDASADRDRSAVGALLILMAGLGLGLAVAIGWLVASPLYCLATAVWTLSLVQLRWVTVQYLNWGDMNRFTATVTLNAAARVAGFLVGASLFGSAGASLLFGSLCSLVATAVTSPRRGSRGRSNLGGLKRLLAVGGVMTLVSAASVFINQGIYLSGSRHLGTEAFAAFAAQVNLSQASFLVTAGFLAVAGFPRVKAKWDQGSESLAQEDVSVYAWVTLLAGVVIAAAWLVAGEWITTLFLTAKYAGSVVPAVITLAMCLATVGQIIGWIPQLRFQQNSLARLAWFAAGLFLTGAAILGGRWGIPGILCPLLVAVGALVLLVARLARPPQAVLLVSVTTLVVVAGMSVSLLA